MIAIGSQLKSLGFDVVVSISEPYATLATDAGLETEVIISSQQFHEMVGDPAVWKTVRGVRRVLRAMSEYFVRPHHLAIKKHHRSGETILVSHPLDFASRAVREADPTTPLAAVHLQPVLLRNTAAPPRLTPWWFEISKPAWAMKIAFWMADHFGLDPVIRPAVNRLRSEYGLPRIRRVLDKWWLSPDRIIALYPEWFAPESNTYCPTLRHAGFPLNDLDGTGFDPPPDFPVAFTCGTAQQHGREFFQRAVASCVQLQRPGLLLSSHPDNFPNEIPELVQTCTYVSFRKLLPRCAAIVHHGGIGTTSQAFAAGIPQVVRPLAFDQFDNATRVERLGCGVWLKQDKKLAASIERLISSEWVRSNCQVIKDRCDNAPRGASVAAKEIESVFHNHNRNPVLN